MMWNEKLRIFLKNKGVSQKEAGLMLNISPPMMSRYLAGKDNVTQEFIIKLLKEFPDIDLRLIFSDAPPSHVEIEKPAEKKKIQINVLNELTIIEEKITLIKDFLAQNSHKEK